MCTKFHSTALQTLLLLDRTFEGKIVPAKTHAEMLELVTDCVGIAQTWKVLKKQLMPLFYHVILPVRIAEEPCERAL